MQWAVASAAFLASAVEFVEALTIVLVVGVTMNWRSSLLGALAAEQPLERLTLARRERRTFVWRLRRGRRRPLEQRGAAALKCAEQLAVLVGEGPRAPAAADPEAAGPTLAIAPLATSRPPGS